MMDRATARKLLPKVGERRREVPTIAETGGYNEKPQPCVVIEVNEVHLWYTVRFENGLRETYKVPNLEPGGGGPHE